MNLKDIEQVKKFLAESESESDYEARKSEIIEANGGEYPSGWFAEIINSGFIAEISTKWEGK
jgi:hypothetical protein